MSRTQQRTSDDDGFGLIYVIAIGAVVSGLVAMALAATQNALRSSAQHVSYTQAVDAAETGIDQTLARAQALNDAGLAVYDSTVTIGGTLSDEGEQARTMLEALADADPDRIQDTPQGEYLAVIPGNRPSTAYAISWIPSRDNARKVRVLKSEFLFSTWRPKQAILTGGDLLFSGSTETCVPPSPTSSLGECLANVDDPASVHSNANVDIGPTSTSSVQVTGSISASDACDPQCLSYADGSGSEMPPITVPDLSPEKIYKSQATNTPVGRWHDFCWSGSTATVRHPDPDGGEPCTGEVVHTFASTSDDFFGWTYSVTAGVPTWHDGRAALNGVIYAHHGNIQVDENESGWTTSLLASADESSGVCDKSGGNIRMTLRTIEGAQLAGVVAAAGQDLVIGANFTAGTGLFSAVDQVDGDTSSTTLYGAIVAGDECHTPGSPANQPNAIQGITLYYDASLDTAIGDIIRQTLWLEL